MPSAPYTFPRPLDALAGLWSAAGGAEGALDRAVIDDGPPVLPSCFHVDVAARATIGAAALAASELWRLRTGEAQGITIDARRAAAGFGSERFLRVDGGPAPDIWSPVAGHFQAGDGRWVQLHTNFDHHRDGILSVLGAENDRESVAAAIKARDAADIERDTRAIGMPVAFVRTPEEWRAHPQALALATQPLFEITRIGDAPPEPMPEGGDRPMSGIRVLDLTRVVAGPVCGRFLAGLGGDVIRIAGPHLPSVAPLVIDTGLGKRSAFVDLREETGRHTLAGLIRGADVFVQGYRPGAIASHGFSAEDTAALRPGIVHVELCAYGWAGPWAGWRGFDSLTQSATGIVHEGTVESGSDKPRPLPVQALDHGTGYLAAFGAMIGLARRATIGGSWRVRVALAQTGRWIDSLGRVDGGFDVPPLTSEAVADILEQRDSPFGRLTHVGPMAGFEKTPMRWDTPPVPLGTHPAAW